MTNKDAEKKMHKNDKKSDKNHKKSDKKSDKNHKKSDKNDKTSDKNDRELHENDKGLNKDFCKIDLHKSDKGLHKNSELITPTKNDKFEYILKTTKRVLDKLEVKFMLCGGTALGAYRENGFISFDKDIDIMIFKENHNDKIIEEMLKEGFVLLHTLGDINDGLEYSFTNSKGPKIDIFFVYKEYDYYWDTVYSSNNWQNVHNGIENPKQLRYKYKPYKVVKIDFLGDEFLVPDITYIEQYIGKDWRIPNPKHNCHFTPNICDKETIESHPFHLIDNYWQKQITVCIKTFIRPECLANCIKSIRLYYPNIHILVADDSDDIIKEQNKTILNQYTNIDLIQLNYDMGLSFGRNGMFKKAETKYALCIDDDTIFDSKTDIEKMYKFLEETDYDIIAGISNLGKTYAAHFIKFSPDKKFLYYKEETYGYIPNNFCDAQKTDRTLNYFLAKRESIVKSPWENSLKLGEHTIFFVNAWINRLRVAITKDVVFSEKKTNSKIYTAFRNRAHAVTYDSYLPYKLTLLS